MQSWLEGRIWVGKGAQATGMTASLRIQSSKADSNTWESFTRSGLKLESVHQESPRSDVFRKRATKPLLNQRQHQKHLTWAVEKKNWTVAQWSNVLFSDESKFCISFGNQGPRVWRTSGEAQNPCCLKSSVKFPQSVMIWAAMSSAGVGPLCFLKSGSMTMVLLCLIGQQTRLTWTPLRIYGVLSRGRWETPDPTMQMSWRPLSKKPGLPYHLSSATNWSPPCHAELRQ